MVRCKLDRPERAEYLRIFCATLLTDEDFETLTRAQFGSACLLMFHAWAKQGSLPSAPRKLAALARCTMEELEDLRAAWPKLVPLEDMDETAEPGARVTIPYLWREWQQVMGFYAAQKERSGLGVAARRAKGSPKGCPTESHDEPMGQPMEEPVGEPSGIPNQAQAQAQAQAKAKEYPLPPRGNGKEVPPLVQEWHGRLRGLWPKTQPDGKAAPGSSRAETEKRFASIVRAGTATPEELAWAGHLYVQQKKHDAHYVVSLETFLGPKRIYEEFLEGARAEMTRRAQ
jgi:hypothetical protein